MKRLASRKFWVAIGIIVSTLVAEFAGVQVSPEAIAAVVLMGATYVFGQGIVDKSVVTEQIKVAGDTGRLQLELYAKNLEEQLTKTMNQLEFAVDGPSIVPDLEE